MRRIVLLAIVVGLGGCRCGRSILQGPPAVLAPRASDAGPSSICGSVQASVRGAYHATPSGRTFYVWTPPSYDASRPLPVVFAVHGLGSDGPGFQKWFKMEQFVDEKAIVVYPDAKGNWDIAHESDLEFFDAMIDGLDSGYCIDRARVYAVGFSYGGKMVHHLGCERTSRFRAISVGDGSWGGGYQNCGRLPVLVTHRTRDHDELLEWGKGAAVRWSKINGCGEATDPTDADHACVAWRGCAENASVTFCEDKYFNEKWPRDWNHTVREEYLRLTWRWFDGQR